MGFQGRAMVFRWVSRDFVSIPRRSKCVPGSFRMSQRCYRDVPEVFQGLRGIPLGFIDDSRVFRRVLRDTRGVPEAFHGDSGTFGERGGFKGFQERFKGFQRVEEWYRAFQECFRWL